MTARADELIWVPYFRDDLDADFARFYRVDWETLDGPRFMTRAERVPAYGGVVAARMARTVRAPVEDDTLPPIPQGAQVVPVSALAGIVEMR
jgi:hypothetical protein